MSSNQQNQYRKTFEFTAYNPYLFRFPKYKVIPRENLHLMKELRSKGYQVKVNPDDSRKLCYLNQKGLQEFLSDPIVISFASGQIALPILISIVSAWMYDRIKKGVRKGKETNVILRVSEDGKDIHYNHSGEPLSDSEVHLLMESMKAKQIAYADSVMEITPIQDFTIPIHLEHTGTIVGWAKPIQKRRDGLFLNDIIFTDRSTERRIKSGELRGLSIGGIVIKSTCILCNRDYIECNHIALNQYNQGECVVRIDSIRIAEISVVKNPAQPWSTLSHY
ncbi:MAG: hypothetical protein AAFV98_06140 [Chloroflexota bacterium]